jgi:hypothetical protein
MSSSPSSPSSPPYSPSLSSTDESMSIDCTAEELEDVLRDLGPFEADLAFDPVADSGAGGPLLDYPRDAPLLFPPLAVAPGAWTCSTFADVVLNHGSGSAPGRKKRQQISRACETCRSAKAKCSEIRPCPRCLRLNVAGQCTQTHTKRSKLAAKNAVYCDMYPLSTAAGLGR